MYNFRKAATPFSYAIVHWIEFAKFSCWMVMKLDQGYAYSLTKISQKYSSSQVYSDWLFVDADRLSEVYHNTSVFKTGI